MSDSNPPASARCDVAQNGWCRVHHSLDCRAVKDALLADRTKERDEAREALRGITSMFDPGHAENDYEFNTALAEARRVLSKAEERQ
jgi:hypothetical protein